MSSGNSIRRGGISVSAYLENLNTLPPADEQRIDEFNPADLDLWTNTQFFDFDPINQGRPEKEQQQQQQHTKDAISIETSMKNGGNFDHFLDEFNEFENFEYSPTFDTFNSSSTAQQMATPVQQVMPAPAPQSPALISTFASASTPAPAPAPVSNARGSKRKASVSVSISSPGSLEEASRLAAEEDKRRRNTAASARFRVKKKQKEQQLEKTAKEMTDRVHQLEQRIQQLELENKWLKGLIVEKNGGKTGEEMMMPPSMLNDSKDGVGTVSSPADSPKQEA